jgi:DNA end-binding protein Ku
VERNEVTKGYENEDGSYVLVDPAEIRKIAPESSRAMDILSFVKESEIDPLFFDSSYFIVPESEGCKPYRLLEKTLEDSKRVAIAKLAMHQREYTVFIRPYNHGLALHTMYFADEIREAPGHGKTDDVRLSAQELKLAEQLVDTLSGDFHLQNYHDEFQARLKQLIEAKQKGKMIKTEPQPHRAPVIDMMTALKNSLEATGGSGKKPVRAKPSPAQHRHVAHRKAS